MSAPPSLQIPAAVASPSIDGQLGGSEWQGAASATLKHPDTGEPTGTVRLLWTGAGLAVGWEAVEVTPAFGEGPEGESLHREDVFEIFLDQLGDHRQFIEIQFDPRGRSYFHNHILTAEPQVTPEGRLTAAFVGSQLWRYPLPRPDEVVSASLYDESTGVWTLEALLPYSLINRRRGATPFVGGETMRANFARYDWSTPMNAPDRQGSFSYWATVPRGCPHISPTRMGYMKLASP